MMGKKQTVVGFVSLSVGGETSSNVCQANKKLCAVRCILPLKNCELFLWTNCQKSDSFSPAKLWTDHMSVISYMPIMSVNKAHLLLVVKTSVSGESMCCKIKCVNLAVNV